MCRVVLLFLAISLVATGQFVAQDDPVMVLTAGKKGVSDKFGRKVDGATISIKKDGKAFKTVTTASNGKFEEVNMPYGHVYEVSISKSGFVKKVLIIDADKNYYGPDQIKDSKAKIEFSPEMLAKESGVDYSIITNTPVAKAKMDATSGQMNYDMGFISRRSKEIQKFMEGVANKEKANEAEFNTKLAAANKAYSSKDYQTAIDKYKEAKALKPDHPG